MNHFLIASLFQLALATMAAASPVYTLRPVSACAACSTLALGINNAGVVAGAAFDATGAHAFFGSGGVYTLFDAPGAFFTEATDIGDDGIVAGSYFSPDGTGRSFLRNTDGSLTILPVVDGAAYTLGGKRNSTGTFVGFYGNDLAGVTGVRAYALSGTARAFTFAYPGALITQALGVNDAGVIVGQFLTSLAAPPRGFIRQPDGTLAAFDVPGALGTSLFDINNNGNFAGGYLDASGTQHGFVYVNGTGTTIDFAGPNTNLWGLNDRGQVVGASYPPGGFFTGPYAGFVATPVPEPATWGYAAVGLLLAALHRRRNHDRGDYDTDPGGRG